LPCSPGADLWDVNVSNWARFGQLVSSRAFRAVHLLCQAMTTKQVVGWGATSWILCCPPCAGCWTGGAARPADRRPVPASEDPGTLQYRECIGRNICIARISASCRCAAQIPTEWRRNWHPGRIAPTQRPEKSWLSAGLRWGCHALSARLSGEPDEPAVMVGRVRAVPAPVGGVAARH
jgi:dimethylamine/trimethylamine dehydrogenase